KALYYQKQAAKNQVKVAKSGYFPSLALVGGYTALEVENALTVTDAMNFGVGLSYNLADIIKLGSKVKAAKSREKEVQLMLDQAEDQVKVQIEDARQNYQLAQRQLEVYQKAQVQATENYRIVKDKYDNGLVDT